MCRKIIITFVLIVSLVVLIYYRSRIERFTANKYLDTMDLSNEMFSKFWLSKALLTRNNLMALLTVNPLM